MYTLQYMYMYMYYYYTSKAPRSALQRTIYMYMSHVTVYMYMSQYTCTKSPVITD